MSILFDSVNIEFDPAEECIVKVNLHIAHSNILISYQMDNHLTQCIMIDLKHKLHSNIKQVLNLGRIQLNSRGKVIVKVNMIHLHIWWKEVDNQTKVNIHQHLTHIDHQHIKLIKVRIDFLVQSIESHYIVGYLIPCSYILLQSIHIDHQGICNLSMKGIKDWFHKFQI